MINYPLKKWKPFYPAAYRHQWKCGNCPCNEYRAVDPDSQSFPRSHSIRYCAPLGSVFQETVHPIPVVLSIKATVLVIKG